MEHISDIFEALDSDLLYTDDPKEQQLIDKYKRVFKASIMDEGVEVTIYLRFPSMLEIMQLDSEPVGSNVEYYSKWLDLCIVEGDLAAIKADSMVHYSAIVQTMNLMKPLLGKCMPLRKRPSQSN